MRRSTIMIFSRLLGNQRENVDVLGKKMSREGTHVLEYLKADKKEQARKYIAGLEESIAKINATTFELHNNVLTNLSDKKVPEAAASLMASIGDIGGIYRSIHERMQQIVEEAPELTDTMEWMYRYLVLRMKLLFPAMRKSFGKCLLEGETNNEL